MFHRMIQTISVIEAVEVSFAFLANRVHPWFHRSPSVGHCLLASQHVLEKVEGLRPPPPVSTANEAEAITISINSQFSTNRAKILEAGNYPEFQTARRVCCDLQRKSLEEFGPDGPNLSKF